MASNLVWLESRVPKEVRDRDGQLGPHEAGEQAKLKCEKVFVSRA